MACSECGAPVADVAACGEALNELNARSFGDARYFIVHRIAVDAYALQHPAEYCESAKSMAAHLVGLCCAIEHRESLAVYSRLQRWLNGAKHLQRPEPPAQRGAITVVDVADADGLDEYIDRVRQWGAAVWDAWSAHHETAREWIEELHETE